MKRQPTKALIILSIAALLVATAGPATAKKPIPKPEPAEYAVSLTFLNDEKPGLSTSCDTAVSIRMFGTAGPGTLSLWDTDNPAEAPLIYVRAPHVDWERNYPTPLADIGFDECHGPSVYIGPDHPFWDYGGALWITIDYEAETVDFLWHFDYYIDAEDLGKKKPRWVATVRENYTMSATASFDPASGLVQGSFPVSWSLKEGRVLVHGYDLFAPIDGTEMMFYMEITPWTDDNDVPRNPQTVNRNEETSVTNLGAT